MNRIPSKQDWGDYEKDLDQKSAFDVFYGKSNEQSQEDFFRDVLSRVSDLRFMPDVPFRYYMIGFKDYVNRGKFRRFSEADTASSFLELIEYKLNHNPQSILPILRELIPTIQYIGAHQEDYKAKREIYGDFNEISKSICEMLLPEE